MGLFQRSHHVPVLIAEVIAGLRPAPPQTILDLTFGQGAYASALMDAFPTCAYFGSDQDPTAVSTGRQRFAHQPRLSLYHGDFLEIFRMLPAVFAPDCIVLDLGISSAQLDDPARGFSFQVDGPLDMRLNPNRGQPAASWLAQTSAADLEKCLTRFGNVPIAARIARSVCGRYPARTHELKRAVLSALPQMNFNKRQRILSQVFLAIRIAVNQELEQLTQVLPLAWQRLASGGMMMVISFHSGEDRIVKQFMRQRQSGQRLRALKPSAQEIASNSRCRSAKLRILKKQ